MSYSEDGPASPLIQHFHQKCPAPDWWEKREPKTFEHGQDRPRSQFHDPQPSLRHIYLKHVQRLGRMRPENDWIATIYRWCTQGGIGKRRWRQSFVYDNRSANKARREATGRAMLGDLLRLQWDLEICIRAEAAGLRDQPCQQGRGRQTR